MNNQRKKQLEFNIKNNELHAQMATILNLIREDISLKGWKERHDEVIKKVVDDLMYIHNNCKVLFRSKKVKQVRSKNVGE